MYPERSESVAVEVDVGGLLGEDSIVEPRHDVRLLHQVVDTVVLFI